MKDLDPMKFTMGAIAAMFLAWLAVIVTCGFVIVHFVLKFW